MDEIKPIIGMDDRWVDCGEIHVVATDGLGRTIIISAARSATAARFKAIRTFKRWIKELQEMDK